MFICKECGAVFEAPDLAIYEITPAGNEYHSACPRCKSFEFSERYICDECGADITDEDVNFINGDELCDRCAAERNREYNPYKGIRDIFDIPMAMIQ